MTCRELGLLAVLCLVGGCSNRVAIQLDAVIESLDPVLVTTSQPKPAEPVPRRVVLVETKSRKPEKVTPADVLATRGMYQILVPNAEVATIVVAVSEQKLTAFDQTGKLVFWEQISTALGSKIIPVDAPRVEHEKPHDHLGEFSVVRKDEDHVSGVHGCPMPYSIFYTSGHAIHQTERRLYHLLGSPASHGCIREGPVAAKWLFDHTPVGARVSIVESLERPLLPSTDGRPTLARIARVEAGPPTPVIREVEHASASPSGRR